MMMSIRLGILPNSLSHLGNGVEFLRVKPVEGSRHDAIYLLGLDLALDVKP